MTSTETDRPEGRGTSSSRGDIFIVFITFSRTCGEGALALIISASNAFCEEIHVSYRAISLYNTSKASPSHAMSMVARVERP